MSTKITHLFHSGFIVETKNNTLVFDYFDYSKSFNIDKGGILSEEFFSNKDNVYVFVSHNHGDHYSPEILKWQNTNSTIKYILSDDINVHNNKSNYYFIKPYDEMTIENIEIKAFGSTDRGVSFLVKVDDLLIFHSGDLNWWHWKNDSEKTQEKEATDYKVEINKLKDYTTNTIDIAFVPVDPRLEEYYYLAGEYFAKSIKPKLLVPMHFSTNFNITKQFMDKIKDLDSETIVITKPGEEFIF